MLLKFYGWYLPDFAPSGNQCCFRCSLSMLRGGKTETSLYDLFEQVHLLVRNVVANMISESTKPGWRELG
jgi:hypothetical protein